MGVPRDDRYGPVMIGRELLIRGYELVGPGNSQQNASVLVNAAAVTFLWGVIDPSHAEYPIDGIEFGRADALMWFGIATAVLLPIDGVLKSHDLPPRPPIVKAKPDPQSLATASTMFESLGDFTKAGRCAEEFGEIFKSDRGVTEPNPHFDRASMLFRRAGNEERARVAMNRASAKDQPSSLFFHRKMGTVQSTTIAGSCEFRNLRGKLKLSKK